MIGCTHYVVGVYSTSSGGWLRAKYLFSSEEQSKDSNDNSNNAYENLIKTL